MLHILASVADFERELIQNRVRTGIKSAKHHGEQLGRKRVMFDRRKALEMATAGASIREICETSGVGRGTISSFQSLLILRETLILLCACAFMLERKMPLAALSRMSC